MLYADWAYYSGTYGGAASEEEITPKLAAANDACDALTFSRINAIGWDGLTPLQQDCVRRFCCIQADFLLENADAVDSAMTRYAINGVSMEFGNASLYTVRNGVAVSNRAMAVLSQSGLASLIAFPPEVDHALA